MVHQELVNYVKSELSRGVSLEQIKKALLSQGWSDHEINETINLATRTFPTPPTPPMYLESKKSSKFVILVLVITGIIIGGIFAFFYMTEKRAQEAPTEKGGQREERGQEEQIGLIDCGTNFDCFVTASQDCKPSRVSYTATVDLFGIIQKTTTYFEIKGLKESKCVFYLRTEKVDLTFPSGTPENATEEAKKMAKQLEGRDGTCKFNTNDLTALLRKWGEGTLEGGASCSLVDNKWECNYTGDWEVAKDCQGTYFSQEL